MRVLEFRTYIILERHYSGLPVDRDSMTGGHGRPPLQLNPVRQGPWLVVNKAPANRFAVRTNQRFAVILHHVIGIFQQMPGQNSHDRLVFFNRTIANELANSSNRRRRRRLATNPIAPDHRFRISNLLLGYRYHAATRLTNCTPRLAPRNRRADLDR